MRHELYACMASSKRCLMQRCNSVLAHCTLQVYVHHFFGAASLINTEGAELRGTMTDPLLPNSYNTIGNGTILNTTDIR